jgi:hypothetical protein
MTTERCPSTGGGRRPGSGNAAAWATAAENKLMGYRANEQGKLPEDFVAAGDGLVAFGAAFILPVQTHCKGTKKAAAQWIYAKRDHTGAGLEADKQVRPTQH